MLKTIAYGCVLLLVTVGQATAADLTYDIFVDSPTSGWGWYGGLSIGIPGLPVFGEISVDNQSWTVTNFSLRAGPTSWTQANFGNAPAVSFDSDGNLKGFNLYQSFSGNYTMTLSNSRFELNDGNNTASCSGCVTFEQVVAAVPEPESYAMLLAGMGLLGFTALRKKQQAAQLTLTVI